MNNQFIDIKKWLQEKLNELANGYFNVSNERKSDSDYFEGEVVVSALSGTPYEDSANIPYQIDVFTAKIDYVMDVFNVLAKTVSNVPFVQIVQTGTQTTNGSTTPVYASHRITPYLNTPVIMEKDIPSGAQHYARIVVFATMLVFYDINDISELKIDNEKINLMNGSLNYTIEPMSNRVSGQELNKIKKKAASVSINFTMVNKNSNFSDKVFQIATGQLAGNTKFVVKVTMNNGKTSTLNMIVGNSSLGVARGQLPSLNVALYLYDDRGDNNNA